MHLFYIKMMCDQLSQSCLLTLSLIFLQIQFGIFALLLSCQIKELYLNLLASDPKIKNFQNKFEEGLYFRQ